MPSMALRSALCVLLSVLSIVYLAAAAGQPKARVRTLYEFPVGSWIENIAVRANGNLLLTRLDVPEIWQVDPSGRTPVAERLVSISGVNSVFGIDEIAPDIFAFAAGNFSFAGGSVQGSWGVKKLDLTHKGPHVSNIADVPGAAGPLNGLTVLPATKTPHQVLVDDVRTGVVYHVSPATGAVNAAINNSLTTFVPNPVFGDSGANGIHIHPTRPDTLYLANTGQHIFASQPIDPSTGTPTREGTVIANVTEPASSFTFDDFALSPNLDRDNAAYIVTGSGNSVERLSLTDGSRKVVAGDLNSTLVAGPTSAHFGRGRRDKNTLYVVTSGAQAAPVNGDEVVGAQVVAVAVGHGQW